MHSGVHAWIAAPFPNDWDWLSDGLECHEKVITRLQTRYAVRKMFTKLVTKKMFYQQKYLDKKLVLAFLIFEIFEKIKVFISNI